MYKHVYKPSLTWLAFSAGNSVWESVTSELVSPLPVDYENLESLFSQNIRQRSAVKETGSEKKKKQVEEINILDGKRSLNINICLKQLRKTNEQIVEMIRRGKSAEVGADHLRALKRIMPEDGEVSTGRGQSGTDPGFR